MVGFLRQDRVTDCCSMALGTHKNIHNKLELRCGVESQWGAETDKTGENLHNMRERKHTPDIRSDLEKTGHPMIEVVRRKKCSG